MTVIAALFQATSGERTAIYRTALAFKVGSAVSMTIVDLHRNDTLQMEVD